MSDSTESDVSPVGGWGLWPTFRHTESIKETSEMTDDTGFEIAIEALRRDSWPDREEYRACARTVVAALGAAGRLLPDGAETHTEHEIDWTARYGRGGTETITYWDLDDAQLAKESAAAQLFQSQMLRHRQRTHRKWPDGSTLIGPWLTAQQ